MHQLCISNLVYGQPYTNIFLNFHLKSLLENLNSCPLDKSFYFIFTEESNIPVIEAHNNFQLLKDKLEVAFIKFDGDSPTNALRYQYQGLQAEWSVRFALEHKVLLHTAAADLYYGMNYFKNALNFISRGYDALVHQPMRAAYESTAHYLNLGELSVNDLFQACFLNLHPIWTSQNWDNPYFTIMPYHLIWSDDKAICMRGFSLSVPIVVPKEWMLKKRGCSDMTYLPHIKNAYYSSDWSELPMIELQQLSSFYPSFSHKKSSIQDLVIWAKKNISPENYSNLARYTIFKKTNDSINEELISNSKKISDEIMTVLKF